MKMKNEETLIAVSHLKEVQNKTYSGLVIAKFLSDDCSDAFINSHTYSIVQKCINP